MGITVFAGMLGVTLFGLYLTPVFYSAIRRRTLRGSMPGASTAPNAEPPVHRSRATPEQPT
jgi:hypothetical protein